MPTPVFEAVAAQATGQRGYARRTHARVDGLVAEWIAARQRTGLGEACSTGWTACEHWVTTEYHRRYGIPLLGFLLWPVIDALISWLVQRTLTELALRKNGNVMGGSE